MWPILAVAAAVGLLGVAAYMFAKDDTACDCDCVACKDEQTWRYEHDRFVPDDEEGSGV